MFLLKPHDRCQLEVILQNKSVLISKTEKAGDSVISEETKATHQRSVIRDPGSDPRTGKGQ
jgi:hypothetical protein